MAKVKDPREAEKKNEEWSAELREATGAWDAARQRLENPMAAKIQKAVLRRLDIERPPVIPASAKARSLGGGTYPQNPEASALFRLMVFLKYGITFRELIYELDINKDSIAHRRLMAVHRDFWRVQSGTRLQDIKLKFSWDHFYLITDGFDFGIKKLTAEQLGDCLDKICPCQQKHTPDYYKKVRAWVDKACQRLIDGAIPPQT